jgi:predicted MFS family arabinose efflux permease
MLPARSPAYRWVILVVAFLGVFGAMGLGRFGYSAVLPDMEKSLELTSAQAGSLASWNLAAYLLMALAGGFLAARFGPRLVVTTGLAVTTAGLLATGFAGGLAAASAARFVTGLGNGLVFAPSLALLVAWFSGPRLGLASTLVASATGLGLVVAGPVVPRLIAAASGDWRVAWYFFAAVTALTTILTAILQRKEPQAARSDFRDVFSSRHAWHLGFIYLLYGFAHITYLTFFQKRLIGNLGFSDESAGNLFLLAGMCSIVLGVFGGWISDRIGRGRALAVLLSLQAVAACLFGLRLGVVGPAISAVLFGFGVFSVPGLIGAACGDGFGARLAFASFGFVTVFIGVGQSIGPYVSGLLEDSFASLGPSYVLSAAIFAVAAIAALLLPPARVPGRATPRVR